MINWNNIVPEKDYGYLPTTGELKVELEGYDYITLNNEPKFTIDTENALALLKEAGVFSNPILTIRELIQNTIDATYLRIWEENKQEIIKIENDSHGIIDYKEYEKILKRYPLEIEVLKETDDLIIKVKDNGIGFSRKTLKYLEKVASSKNDYKRIEIIEKIPPFIQPSGNFGVGFQSIFLLADSVLVETSSFYENMTYNLTLKSPSSGKGSIYITSSPKKYSEKYGTTIKFKVKEEALRYLPKGIDLTLKEEKIENNEFLEQIHCEAEGIKNNLLTEYKNIILPIKYNGELLLKAGKKFNYYLPEEKLEISHTLTYVNGIQRQYTGNVFFKNQKVLQHGGGSSFTIDVNILGEKAQNVLQINRNQFNRDYGLKFQSIKNRAMVKYLSKTIFSSDIKEPNISQGEHNLFFDISVTLFSILSEDKKILENKEIKFNGKKYKLFDFWKLAQITCFNNSTQENINYFKFYDSIEEIIIKINLDNPNGNVGIRASKILNITGNKLVVENDLNNYQLGQHWYAQILKDYSLIKIEKKENLNYEFTYSKMGYKTEFSLEELYILIKEGIKRNRRNLKNIAGLIEIPLHQNFQELEYQNSKFNFIQSWFKNYLKVNYSRKTLFPFKISTKGELEKMPIDVYCKLICIAKGISNESKKEDIRNQCEELYEAIARIDKGL